MSNRIKLQLVMIYGIIITSFLGSALFLVNIDFFKKINDTYGHATGDAALKTLSRLITRMIRRYNGFAGRWGGDEFIGVLPLSGEAARDALSEMCDETRRETIGDGVRITISAGVAGGEGAMPIERLSEMADRALYHSKAKGKDQASLFSPEDDLDATDGAVATTTVHVKEEKEQPALPANEEQLSLGVRLKRYFRERLFPSTLLGVRWMAPFMAGGGILIGLASCSTPRPSTLRRCRWRSARN